MRSGPCGVHTAQTPKRSFTQSGSQSGIKNQLTLHFICHFLGQFQATSGRCRGKYLSLCPYKWWGTVSKICHFWEEFWGISSKDLNKSADASTFLNVILVKK